MNMKYMKYIIYNNKNTQKYIVNILSEMKI